MIDYGKYIIVALTILLALVIAGLNIKQDIEHSSKINSLCTTRCGDEEFVNSSSHLDAIVCLCRSKEIHIK